MGITTSAQIFVLHFRCVTRNHYERPTGAATALAIFHKQIGDLVLLESALRRLARATGSTVDLITRSGFEPLVSLMTFANFRSKPGLRGYDTIWCFDDRKKSTFFSFVSRGRQKKLLINPGMPIQWYHRRAFSDILAPDLGQLYIAEYYWQHTPPTFIETRRILARSTPVK